jgi:hypothetical protein
MRTRIDRPQKSEDSFCMPLDVAQDVHGASAPVEDEGEIDRHASTDTRST